MIAIFIAPFLHSVKYIFVLENKGLGTGIFSETQRQEGLDSPDSAIRISGVGAGDRILPATGRFRRGMKLVGNYWLGVLLYMIFFIVIAELGRFLLLHVFRVGKDKICVPRIRRIVGCVCATLIMCISFWEW